MSNRVIVDTYQVLAGEELAIERGLGVGRFGTEKRIIDMSINVARIKSLSVWHGMDDVPVYGLTMPQIVMSKTASPILENGIVEQFTLPEDVVDNPNCLWHSRAEATVNDQRYSDIGRVAMVSICNYSDYTDRDYDWQLEGLRSSGIKIIDTIPRNNLVNVANTLILMRPGEEVGIYANNNRHTVANDPAGVLVVKL